MSLPGSSSPSSDVLAAFLRDEYHNLVAFAASRLRAFRVWSVTAEDVVQETLLNVYATQPGQVTNPGYLYTAIRNQVSRHGHKELREKDLADETDDTALDTFQPTPSTPEDELLSLEELEAGSEEVRALLRALGECARQHRTNETLRAMLDPANPAFFVGKKPRELAPTLGIGARTVTNYLTWIRQNILPCAKERFARFLASRRR